MAKPRIRLKVDAGPGLPVVHTRFSGIGGGAHHGASQTLRSVAEWHAADGSADSDLLPDLPELTYRARDIHRNNGLAHSIIQTSIDNIVGTGLRLSAQPDYLALGQSKDWADEFAAKSEGLFHEFWWSTACHAGDTKTGDMLCEEFLFAKFNNGGTLILPLWIPERGDGFATKLQTVEIDRLSNPNNVPDTPNLRGGIEFDTFGVPLAYHVRRGHPGERFFMGLRGATTWERIPRRTPHGRLRVIHDFDGDRADQTRGKPLLSAVLDQFKNIDRYVKAEIQAALLNAMIWGAITTPLDHEQIEALFQNNEEKYLLARDAHKVKMQAGTLATLFPGDKLEPFMPSRPAAQFGVFHKNVARIIAVGADMPYEVAMKDYSDSNYSNTRAAMVEFWRSVSRKRDRLGAGCMDPIYGLWMEEMVNAGRLEAPNFYAMRRAYLRCTWIGPGRGYVDKVKEATGDRIMLDGNMITLQRVAAEQGMHWRELLDQRKTEWTYEHVTLGLPDHTATRAANPTQWSNADSEESGDDEPMPSNRKRAPANAALTDRLAYLEGKASTPVAAPPHVTFAEGAIQVRAGDVHTTLPTDAIRIAVEQPVTHVHIPPRGTVEKEVIERDADGRILRTRETEV